MKNNWPDNLSRRNLLKTASWLLIHASLPSDTVVWTVQWILNLENNLLTKKCKEQVLNNIQSSFFDTIVHSTNFFLRNYQEKMYMPHAHYSGCGLDSEDLTDQDHLDIFTVQMDDAIWGLRELWVLDISQSEFDLLVDLDRTKNECDIDEQSRGEYMRIVFDSISKITFDIELLKKKFLVETLSNWYRSENWNIRWSMYFSDENYTYNLFIDETWKEITAEIFEWQKLIHEAVFLSADILSSELLQILEEQVIQAKEKLWLMLRYSPDELLSYYNESESSWNFESALKNSEWKFHNENLKYLDKSTFTLSSKQQLILESLDLDREEEIEESAESWNSNEWEYLEEECDNWEEVLLEKK